MTEPFVGRVHELDVLRTALSDAVDGRPRIVLVDGPPGMGKSALVRHFLRGVETEQVLVASGDENEASLAYALVDQMLRGLPVPLPPSLQSLVDPSTSVVDPLTVGAGLVELLGDLEKRAPVVLSIDDLQWADAPSLHAVVFALRRLRGEPVLALLSVRTEALWQLPAGLRRVVEGETGVAVRLEGLEPSSVKDLASLVGRGKVALRAASRLHEHTGGSPLHIRALLDELPVEALEAQELPAPRPFAAIVLSRVAACSEQAQQVLAAAAVLGLRTSVTVCGTVAGVDDPGSALEEVRASGLVVIRPTDSGEEVSFSHPLVRAAIYQDLGPARRADLHARAAEAAESEHGRLFHRARTVERDPQLAAEVAGFARREASRRAWSSAAANFQLAAQLSPGARKREGLTLKAIEALLLSGEHPKAVALGDGIDAFADTARRRCTQGHLCLVGGLQAEAEAHLTAAWEACDPRAEPALAARIATLLSTIVLNEARTDQAVVWANRALAADPHGRSTVDAAWLLVVGLASSGREEEALAFVDGLPETPGDPAPPQLAGVGARGVVRMWTDDLARARADLAAVARVCTRDGPFHTGFVATLYLSEAEYRLGAWDEAIAHAAAAVSAAEDADQGWQLSLVHAVAAFPLAGRGLWEDAESHVQAAEDAARKLSDATSSVWSGVARARLAAARGDPQGAVDALTPVAAWASDRPALDEPGVQPWRDVLADALVSLDRLEEADAVLARLEEVAAARRRRSALAAAARVRGTLEAARGRRDQAESAFRRALEHLEGLELPFEAALSEEAYGRFLRRLGKRRMAAEHLTRALETFTLLGARPFVERCEQELAACGLSPASAAKGGVDRLTAQELAVASRAAAGLRNRDIARELVVSVKTIEYHLGNVFTKLGISSRTQLHGRLNPPQR